MEQEVIVQKLRQAALDGHAVAIWTQGTEGNPDPDEGGLVVGWGFNPEFVRIENAQRETISDLCVSDIADVEIEIP